MKHVFILCLLLFTPLLAQAEEQIHIYISAPGRNKIPIALPKPVSKQPGAEELYEVIKHDLELSGWVSIVEPATYLEKEGTSARFGEFKFENWDSVEALALAKTTLDFKDDRYRSEIWVYDIAGRKKLGAKAFNSSSKHIRNLGHKVANEIIKQLTGQEAPFNTRFSYVNDVSGKKEIYIMDFDGANQQRITRNKTINLQPAWSPDNNKLSFTSYISGNPDLYLADLRSGRIFQISSREGINIGADWHPNSKSLVATLSPDGNPDIYTLSSQTGRTLKRLTKHPGIDVSPSFSPDGSKITFVSERSGGAQIYVMNADGSNVKRVSFAGTHNTDPTFSPDGSKIAFVSRAGNFDVWVVNVDGTNLTRITQDMGDNEDPTWSPDGNYLAFLSTRSGSSQIWMSTADGTHQVQLSKGKGNYSNPDWSSPVNW